MAPAAPRRSRGWPGHALFSIGAAATYSPRLARRPWVVQLPWSKLSLALWVAFGILALVPKELFVPSDVLMTTLVGVATMTFLIGSSQKLQQGRPLPGPLRVFSAPASVFLGTISYSLYLIHYPIIAIVNFLILELHLSRVLIFAALCAVGLPVIFLATYAFHLVFERPFMRAAPRADAPQKAVAPLVNKP